MIYKSLLYAALFVVLYATAVQYVNIDWDTSQNSFHENNIIVEGFMYSDGHKNVIVGSSISKLLIQDSLQNNVYNLSLSGKSIYQGLDLIVSKTDASIQRVFIESNLLFKSGSPEFSDKYKSPIIGWIKKHIPVFLEKYSPVGVIINHPFGNEMWRRIKMLKKGQPKYQDETTRYQDLDSGFNKKRFYLMLEEKKRKYAHVPAQQIINKNFNALSEQISQLESRGIEVCFFEVPISSEISEMPFFTSQRKYLDKMFTGYPRFVFSNYDEYQTSDGIHLTKQSSAKYSAKLNDFINETSLK